MKKIIRPFKKLFLAIAHLIDRKIVVPITKLIVLISNKFDKSSKKIENYLFLN